jgi:hypothetical protein
MYPKAAALRALLREVPPDRILIESDAPYQPPARRRGRRNEPAQVADVAAGLAALWEAPPVEAAAAPPPTPAASAASRKREPDSDEGEAHAPPSSALT